MMQVQPAVQVISGCQPRHFLQPSRLFADVVIRTFETTETNMHKLELDPVITEDEVSEIERISQENVSQISLNRRIALTILAYDKERLYKSVADDPATYYHLVKSLEDCMDSLNVQINILKTAETRLMAPLVEHISVKGKMH